MDSPQRWCWDIDSTEIPVYGNQEQSAITDISGPLAITRCCCSIVKATAWRRNSGPATAQRRRLDELLLPEIERQQKHGKEVVVRADAALPSRRSTRRRNSAV